MSKAANHKNRFTLHVNWNVRPNGRRMKWKQKSVKKRHSTDFASLKRKCGCCSRLATVLINCSCSSPLCGYLTVLLLEWHTFKWNGDGRDGFARSKPIVRYMHYVIMKIFWNSQVNNNNQRNGHHCTISTHTHSHTLLKLWYSRNCNVNTPKTLAHSSRLHINQSDMWSLFSFRRGLASSEMMYGKRENFDFYFVLLLLLLLLLLLVVTVDV